MERGIHWMHGHVIRYVLLAIVIIAVIIYFAMRNRKK